MTKATTRQRQWKRQDIRWACPSAWKNALPQSLMIGSGNDGDNDEPFLNAALARKDASPQSMIDGKDKRR